MLELTTGIGANALAAILTAALSSGVFSLGKFVAQRRQTAAARVSADNEAFETALASSNLEEVGTMLRDRFGTVSLEALLNDSVTQDRVFKSLKRLTEVLNQPVPETPAEEMAEPSGIQKVPDPTGGIEQSDTPKEFGQLNYLDLMSEDNRAVVGREIEKIAKAAYMNIRVSGVWTALAGARRHMEQLILPLIADSRKTLSPRIFWNPRLRAAMGTFLSVANRAIHGEEVNFERADTALRALSYIATTLPTIAIDDFPTDIAD